MSGRAVPFHCPYCGDEDLRPHGAKHGDWECRACLRAFSLRYVGLLAPHHPTPAPHHPTLAPSSTADRTEGPL